MICQNWVCQPAQFEPYLFILHSAHDLLLLSITLFIIVWPTRQLHTIYLVPSMNGTGNNYCVTDSLLRVPANIYETCSSFILLIFANLRSQHCIVTHVSKGATIK